MYIDCKMRPYGRTLSRVAKLINVNKLKLVTLYNIDHFIIKGDIDGYIKRYRTKLGKKSHVKNPSKHSKLLYKSTSSMVKYSLKHMLNFKLCKIKMYNNECETNIEPYNMPSVKLPLKGFSLIELVNGL